jgi:hypothetical protein
VNSFSDVALDRPAYGSITRSNPFPTLPREFPGKYLGLRFSFYYNVSTDGTELGPKKAPSPGRECTAEDYLTSIMSFDGGNALSIWPPEPVKITLTKNQKFMVRDADTSVEIGHWAIAGELCNIADCGSVSELGLYTAPATMPASPDIVLTVAETREPCRSGSVKVTLVPAQGQPGFKPNTLE